MILRSCMCILCLHAPYFICAYTLLPCACRPISSKQSSPFTACMLERDYGENHTCHSCSSLSPPIGVIARLHICRTWSEHSCLPTLRQLIEKESNDEALATLIVACADEPWLKSKC